MRPFPLLVIFLAAAVAPELSAADAKWIHATSAHFDMYAQESEGDVKAALTHLEAARAFFLASTRVHDPGGKTVRIVAFRSEGDYGRNKPADVRTAKAYGKAGAGAVPATVVVQTLKADVYDQLFREYAQLALDDSAPNLPYWFRAGWASVYSTLKPVDAGINIGSAPKSSFRNGEVGDVSLQLLFSVNREALMASREKAAMDFNSSRVTSGGTNGVQATAGSREPGGAAATALQSVQSSLNESQDFARAAWMLVHMTMFQPDYRTKFGELLRALAAGSESGAAFGKVYDAPISKLHTDLVTYSKQTGIMVMTAPFKVEKQPAPEVKSVEKEEQDRILADLK